VKITRTTDGYHFSGADVDCTVTHISYPRNTSEIVRHDHIEGLSVELTVVLPKMPPLSTAS
jgi:hypothetical protein